MSIFVILLGYIKGQCISTTPNTSSDCTNLSGGNNYCCMISSPGYDPTNRQCIQISKNNFFGQTIYYDTNNLSWNLNCGDNAQAFVAAGGQCGNTKPNFAFDCWSFSTLHNSCCYYLSGNFTGTPGCQWFPSKFSGNTLNSQSKILLECKGNYASVNFALIVLLALVLLVGNL